MSGFPLGGHFGSHRKGNTLLIAARNRNAAVAQRAEERGQYNALIKFFEDSGFDRIVIPDVQSRAIHALCKDLVDVLGHDSRVSLAVEHEHFSAVFFLGVLLRLGGLCLMEHVTQIRHEERDLHRLFSGGCFGSPCTAGR